VADAGPLPCRAANQKYLESEIDALAPANPNYLKLNNKSALLSAALSSISG
jgi:hypothetical protein